MRPVKKITIFYTLLGVSELWPCVVISVESPIKRNDFD